MKTMKIALSLIFALTVSTTMVYGGEGCPEAIQSGKEIFKSPKELGSTTNTSCATARCHPDGEGLKGVAKKKKYENKDELKKMINLCIKKAVKGKELAPDSKEMKYLSAYVRSIGQEGEGSEHKELEHEGSGHKEYEHEGSGHKELEHEGSGHK